MELIIGLLVIGVVGYFVFFRKKDEPVVAETSVAPYKVDMPVPAADVAPQPEPTPVVVAAVEGAGVVEVIAAPVAEEPAKKTRKPRAPKAEAKPATKKAAPKKAAAIKAKPKATKSKKA